MVRAWRVLLQALEMGEVETRAGMVEHPGIAQGGLDGAMAFVLGIGCAFFARVRCTRAPASPLIQPLPIRPIVICCQVNDLARRGNVPRTSLMEPR